MNIDLKKMLEQDESFRDFTKESLLGMISGDKSGQDLLQSIYSFYNIGMTPEQVADWIRLIKGFNAGS